MNDEGPIPARDARTPHDGHLSDDRTVLHADPTRLKGLGHPLRIALLDELLTNGPATASVLAERLGESSGATSYHLRQLEKHGFIEEDESRGQGRERWWRRRPGQIDVSPEALRDDPAALESAALVVEQFSAARTRRLDDFLRRGIDCCGLEWLEAASVTNAIAALTVDELRELGEKVQAILLDTAERFRGRERPADARTVVVQFNAFPLVDDPGFAGTPPANSTEGTNP
jgi:DNA-binding transcriptional ArsR family regulator